MALSPLLLLNGAQVTYQTIAIQLGQKQQTVYDSVATSGKERLKKIIDSQSKRGLAESMLTVILRLRQVVLHPALVPADSQVWQSDSQIMCFACTGTISEEDTSVAKCAHFFCTTCVDTIKTCPCGAEGKLTTKPYTRDNEEEQEETDSFKDDRDIGSAKLEALVVFLNQISKHDKSLIFSSFVKFLKIVECRLGQEGISCVLFHGKMSKTKRDGVIKQFSKNDSSTPRVMLISLAAGAVGLNLTVANHVFIMDPCLVAGAGANPFNSSNILITQQPSIEHQAVDRVNRIGQTKEVHVFRLVAKDTIEDKVLKIQAAKTALIKEALSETTSQRDFQSITNIEPEERSRIFRNALEL
ncbi:P-loop containing nucleoside triphosphate hydrolase protein [Mycena pura]|uniref:P-loop containing nucleoside triphosphate hydrolase protein n=1 Tax=Mycena pura TaxID=153505 RepID=A0AAD6Y5G8_9AGAR|nr:P-loop containing nucleoside triphosphate hydrolase protein [Mycena pura]